MTIVHLKTLPGTGHGADAEHIAAAVSMTAAGSGADALVIYRAIGVTDRGVGDDTGAEYETTYLATYDPEAFTVAARVPDADTGSAAMTLAHATAATLAETARERETLRLTATLGPADTGAGAEAFRAREHHPRPVLPGAGPHVRDLRPGPGGRRASPSRALRRHHADPA